MNNGKCFGKYYKQREIFRGIIPGNSVGNMGDFGKCFGKYRPGNTPRKSGAGNVLSIYANFGQNQPICDFWSKSGPFFIVVCGQNFHYMRIVVKISKKYL